MVKEAIQQNEVKAGVRVVECACVRCEERTPVMPASIANVRRVDVDSHVIRMAEQTSIRSGPAADVQYPPRQVEVVVFPQGNELFCGVRRLPETVGEHVVHDSGENATPRHRTRNLPASAEPG